MPELVSAKFISKKIRKVRWRPRDGFGSPNPSYFLSGSWDDQENEIALWNCPLNEGQNEPVLISRVHTTFDVNDINFIDVSTFLIGLGDGSVIMVKIQGSDLHQVNKWRNVHHYRCIKAPCTNVVYQSPEIASVGEDGKLNIMRVNQEKPHRVIEADSCSLNAAIFTSQNEILTGNSRGMIKLWDLRSTTGTKPILTTSLAEDSEVGVSSMDRHPFQGHVIAVGSYDGTLAIYDMRKAQAPVTVLAGPECCMTQIRFHPDESDHLFTTSESGAVWHWTTLAGKCSTPLTTSPMNVWLSGDLAAQQLDIKEVLSNLPLPVNSVDVSGERLIFGGDNEALYYIQKLVL